MLNGNLTLSNATLGGTGNLTVAGTFTSFGGNFQGGGTVYLDGATSTISGNFSLYDRWSITAT